MPIGVAGAVALGGAALSAGASAYGASQQAGAVKDAAKQQAAAAAQQREDFAPWRTTGGTANTQAANLLGINGQPAADTAMQTFQSSPGYAFQLEQGLRGVDAGAAAKGMLRSGATLKAEQTFGQGLANAGFWKLLQQTNGPVEGRRECRRRAGRHHERADRRGKPHR
jgi:hypothetical protein